VPDFTALYQNKQRIMGRHLFLVQTEQGKLVMRLYDVHTGKDSWKQTFAANSVALRSDNPHLAGAIEPDGKVTVIDLRTRKEVLKVPAFDPKEPYLGVDPAQLKTTPQVHLLQDAQQLYLAFQHSDAAAAGGPWPAFLNGSGVRTVPVNGRIYAFAQGTSELKWYTQDVSNQMIVLDHFERLPMILCVARYNKGGAAAGRQWQAVGVVALDKVTAKQIQRMDDIPYTGANTWFYGLNVDARAGKAELVGQNIKLTYVLAGSTSSATDKGTDSKPPPPGGSQPGAGGLGGGREPRLQPVVPQIERR
jgi:hypothetical protein